MAAASPVPAEEGPLPNRAGFRNAPDDGRGRDQRDSRLQRRAGHSGSPGPLRKQTHRDSDRLIVRTGGDLCARPHVRRKAACAPASRRARGETTAATIAVFASSPALPETPFFALSRHPSALAAVVLLLWSSVLGGATSDFQRPLGASGGRRVHRQRRAALARWYRRGRARPVWRSCTVPSAVVEIQRDRTVPAVTHSGTRDREGVIGSTRGEMKEDRALQRACGERFNWRIEWRQRQTLQATAI